MKSKEKAFWRAVQLDRDTASLHELAEELRTKRDKGEITDEEWERWSNEIIEEIIAVGHRTILHGRN